MGLLAGAVACTRYNVIAIPPETIDFELVPFRPVMPGSAVREREGFVPFEPGEPWEIGARKWAFRIRVDKVTPDTTAVNERVKELIKQEMEHVGPVSPKVRQQLRQQAEDEMMQHPMPKSQIIECVLDENVLYVGTASKGHLGRVTEMLKRVGVEVEFKTPWLDAGQEDLMSELVEIKEPGQSIWGCHFLKKLLSDPEVYLEPESGSVKLITPEGVKMGLSGPVLNEVDRRVDDGAELLSAKLMIEEGFAFALDGLSYRISAFKMENIKGVHWTEALDERMDKVKQLWEWLDTKYQLLMMSEDEEPTSSED